jgi:hypothetical protein
MSNPSNLYAEKIFAEHPTALWALDDAMEYASLIPSLSLATSLNTWTYGTTAVTVTDESLLDLNDPFPDVKKWSIAPTTSTGALTLTLTSDEIAPVLLLNTTKETMTIGMYVYVDSVYISSISLGHFVDSGTVSSQTFSNLPVQQWTFLSKTVARPTSGTSIKFRITINTKVGGSVPGDYQVYVNGINFGQWNEEFNATSMGQDTWSIVDKVYGLEPNVSGIRVESYGLQDSHGYYIVEDSLSLCKNSGIPLVYGASNVSTLYPSTVSGAPSLIIPGQGLFNKSGQYKTFTAEMWLRINSETYEERRIFGPIGHYEGEDGLVQSTDGLYVSGPFIKLKVGNSVGSHYVSEWNRPMLVNIRISNNNAALVINGEQVFSITFDSSQLNFPNKIINDDGDIYENDWLGFFAYEDIPTLDVDCIAIYPYSVPEVMAKRRWVYGQAVEFPNDINTAYSGSSYLVDYSVAGYTNNYNYPDLALWRSGNVIENLSLANNYLAAPTYSLPQIVFSGAYSAQQLLDVIDSGSGTAESFFLKVSSEQPNSYIYFNKLGFLTDQTKAFYGVFDSYSNSNQVLFHLEDGSTGNYFEIGMTPTDIVYTLKYNGELSTILSVDKPDNGTVFTVGLDIDKFSNYFGGNVKTFFGKSQTLILYVGNKKDFSKQFAGNIYRLGFCTPRNLRKLASGFSERGIPEDAFIDAGELSDTATTTISGGDESTIYWTETYDGGFATTEFLSHTATYTMLIKYDLDVLKFDIATDSYWEDSIPLSYFAKYVKNETGGNDYKLDTIQLNLSYPEIEIFDGIYHDTTGAQVKTYVTFQYLSTGANSNSSVFTSTKRLRASNVLIPGNNWTTTRYEVLDNTIIYPPQGVDFNSLALVLHVEMVNAGSLSNPIRIKSIQLSPKSLSKATSNPINTRLGKEIYSYAKTGLYYDYAGRNPFTIYKGSTPYLYLTKNTGLELKDTEDNQATGFSFPINSDLSPKYSVSAIQLAMRVNKDYFATVGIGGAPAEPLFELEAKDRSINFYTQAVDGSGKRAVIYGIDTRTGALAEGILFYLNGKIVKDLVVNLDEWNIMAMSFTSPLSLNSYSGSFRVVGKNILVNNLSHYQLTSAQEVLTSVQRMWGDVKEPTSGTVVMWSYWTEDGDGTWSNVLNLGDTVLSSVNPEDFYKAYTGTNKKIVEDDSQLTFGDYQYNFYTEVSWESNTTTPV